MPNSEFLNLWAVSSLLAVLAVSFFTMRVKALRWLSPPVLALLLTVALAQVGAIPKPEGVAAYGFINGPILQAAIFMLMLQVDFGVIRRAGPSMAGFYFVGAAGVLIGLALTLLVPWIGQTLDGSYPTLAGMYAATYIGGSVNFNAVAAVMGLARDGPVFGVAVAVDNFMGMVWLAASVLAAPFLAKLWPQAVPAHADPDQAASAGRLTTMDLAIVALATVAAILLARYLGTLVPAVHPIVWLTTFALIAAQTPLSRIGPKVESIAELGLYLFIAAIGVDISVSDILGSGAMAGAALALVAICFAIHGLLMFAAARWLKADTGVVLVASMAGIGGPPTALALAEAIGRPDLRIPGVAAGLLGYAIGTYVGVATTGVFNAVT